MPKKREQQTDTIALTVNPASPVPVYEQLTNQVLFAIAAGRLVPGAQLPSARAVADRCGINLNTAQKAYRDLELRDLITTRPGTGCYIAAGAAHKAIDLAADGLARKAREIAREAREMDYELIALISTIKEAYKGTEALY